MKKFFLYLYNIFLMLIGINIIILVHELAHLITALHYGFPVVSFHVGIGTELFSFVYSDIPFIFHAVPLLGYVEFTKDIFDNILFEDLSILLVFASGGLINIILGIIIYKKYKHVEIESNLNKYENGFLSFFVNLVRDSITDKRLLLKSFGLVSICIGVFNLLPIMPLDGGKMVYSLLIFFEINETIISAFEYIGLFIFFYIVFSGLFKDFKSKFASNELIKATSTVEFDAKKFHSIVLFKFMQEMKLIGYSELENLSENYESFISDIETKEKPLTELYNFLKTSNNLYITEDDKFTSYSEEVIKLLNKREEKV